MACALVPLVQRGYENTLFLLHRPLLQAALFVVCVDILCAFIGSCLLYAYALYK